MSRKNRRDDQWLVRPLDITPDDVPVPRVETLGKTSRQIHDERNERERLRGERQRQARIRGAMDWHTCLVPGCGNELRTYGQGLEARPTRTS